MLGCHLQLSYSQTNVTVVTSKGPVIGLRWDPHPYSQAPYDAFIGIPYGEIPARFQPALPRSSWVSPLEAHTDGPACPQTLFPFSEDCLYINVFTPVNASTSTTKYPVMAYIHGSAFSYGSSISFIFGPDFIVPQGVILVSMNFRLGAAGFLSMGSPLAPGNLGLLDTRLALQWIQEEILAFGGDPAQVTLLGHSAGAAMSMFHYFSPASAGLFHRAILQSGSPLGTWARISAREAARRAKLLADAVGCDTSLSDAQILTCLQEKDIDTIVDHQNITLPVELVAAIRGQTFPPVEDTDFGDPPFFTDTIEHLLKKAVKNPIPMIVGFTPEEGFCVFTGDDWRLTESNMKGFIPWSMKSEPTDLQRVDIENKVRNKYMPDTVETNKILNLVHLFTDYIVAYPVIEMIRQFSDTTYAYVFTYDGPWAPMPDFLAKYHFRGVYHGADLLYLYYYGQDVSTCRSNLPNLYVKDNMVRWWTNFVKTGVPDPSGAWKTVSHGQYLKIDYPVSTLNSSEVEDQHYKFWDDFRQYDEENAKTEHNSAASLQINLLLICIVYVGFSASLLK